MGRKPFTKPTLGKEHMRRTGIALAGTTAFVSCVAAAWAGGPPLNANTNLNNFYIRGTQPDALVDLIEPSTSCTGCHSGDATTPIYDDWNGSLKAHAGRDPLMYACLDIANADAPGIGDTCLRCHLPKGWLEGRSTPTNGSSMEPQDRDSINCNFCHRMVDPYSKPGAPAADAAILAALGLDAPIQSMDLGVPSMPGDNGSAGYVIDPEDRRRGPRPQIPGEVWMAGGPLDPEEACCDFFHRFVSGAGDTYQSALHRRSDMCSTCHDVSFPHLMRQPNGSYTLNALNQKHPTGNKYDMLGEQRTYSEWLKSTFAATGVDMGGRFGGLNNPIIRDCQDCHMPVDEVQACLEPRSERPTTRRHYFSGASTWVLDAIGAYYGPGGESMTNEISEAGVASLQANKARNIDMLQRAADLSVGVLAEPVPKLQVRVTNQTGHKLPTGYPEGRRIFLTVEYYSPLNPENPIQVLGEYDFNTATLHEESTKVYEAHFGIDAPLAAALNRPEGPSSHAALSNKCFKDNRIPPRGFTNAAFAAVQAAPVAYEYPDGQYWDDTLYNIPAGACSATVKLYYQSTTREYMEFLRDNNPNASTPGNNGEIAYNLWAAFGFGEPVLMATQSIALANPGDTNLTPPADAADVQTFVAVLLGLDTHPLRLCAADVDGNGAVDGRDVQPFVDLIIP